jgi:uncharacterized phage protein (TIGR01671 family)
MENSRFKFRVWYCEYMTDDITSLTFETTDGKVAYIFIDGDDVPIDDVKLMQHTGLEDKNRKDIYDGDIVELSKENRKLLGNIGIVKFKSGEFSIESPEFEHHDDIRLRKFYTHLEVIGNIYENPELLNEDSKYD